MDDISTRIDELNRSIKSESIRGLRGLIPIMQKMAVLKQSSTSDTVRNMAASMLSLYITMARDFRAWSGSRECF